MASKTGAASADSPSGPYLFVWPMNTMPVPRRYFFADILAPPKSLARGLRKAANAP